MHDAHARVVLAGRWDAELAAELFENRIGLGAAGDGRQAGGLGDGDSGIRRPENG
jgi:hypothetical protein